MGGRDSDDLVPTADSADNISSHDVVGNKTDTVAGDSLVAIGKQQAAQQDMVQTTREFWSELVDLTLSTTQADLAITPTVVVPSGSHGIPSGATIDCVHLMWKCRAIRDNSAAPNAIDNTAAQAKIQIDDVANTGWLDAYNFSDNALACAANGKEPGLSVESIIDIKSRVDAADTYDIQIENCEVDGDNLFLHDFQWGLKISWH